MATKKKEPTGRPTGRPTIAPQRVTVTLSQHHADELQRLADEAGVTRSGLCAHVLERYATQDRELMANDVIAQRLEATNERHMQQFSKRFGDVLLRVAHEVTALRKHYSTDSSRQYGSAESKKIADDAWAKAVISLRPYTQRIKGEGQEEGQEGRDI